MDAAQHSKSPLKGRRAGVKQKMVGAREHIWRNSVSPPGNIPF